jgi:diadenosine tetraphosphate (Ap4A) HIT family hydrolase
MTDFRLDDRLAADTVFVRDWPLSRLLVMNDVRFPWLILVPRRVGVSEFFDLEPGDRVILCEEIATAGARFKALTRCAKINIGALGNVVPQLHIHVVARNPGDALGPAWGSGTAVPYPPAELADFVARIVNAF